jgi:hypothetical protein
VILASGLVLNVGGFTVRVRPERQLGRLELVDRG